MRARESAFGTGNARFAIAATLASMAVFVASPGARASGTLDQSQTCAGSADWHFAGPNQYEAQTFTAGKTGTMDQVDLYLSAVSFSPGGPAPLNVQIRNVLADGSPGPVTGILATGTLAPPTTSGFQWLATALTPSVPVTSGTKYAIVVSSPGPISGQWIWGGCSGNPYSGGAAYGSFDGATWYLNGAGADNGNEDFAFKTYVTAASTCQEADGDGNFQNPQGQHGDFKMDNDNCEEAGQGGNGESDQGDRVDSSDRGDGRDFHSTKIESSKFDAAAHTVTIAGLGTSNGTPVAFTLVALETGNGGLGWVSMIFSDGYSIDGNLISGSIQLH